MRMPVVAFAVMAALAGCTGMSDTQQRGLTGSLGGAAGGAAIGAIAGNAGLGAAIGAGVGLAGGLLYDHHKKAEQAAYTKGQEDARAAAR